MLFRYLAAAAAIAIVGAVTAFAAVAITGAAAAFGAPPAADALLPSPATARTRLATMDTDHDGTWSKAEWLAGEHAGKAFDRMDTNHDGILTREELAAGMAAHRAAKAARAVAAPAQ